MQLHHWFALGLALTPSLASAALFPKDTLVKQIDAKDFKKAMKENVCNCLPSVLPCFFHAYQPYVQVPVVHWNERRWLGRPSVKLLPA